MSSLSIIVWVITLAAVLLTIPVMIAAADGVLCDIGERKMRLAGATVDPLERARRVEIFPSGLSRLGSTDGP